MRKQVLSKISKKQKPQIESLISVLKPKVYITDSSNFKRLVQELTGIVSGSSTACFPSIMDSRSHKNCNTIVYDQPAYPLQYPSSSRPSSRADVGVPHASKKSFPSDSSSAEVSYSNGTCSPDSTISSYNTNSNYTDQEYSFFSLQLCEDHHTAPGEYGSMSNYKLENLFAYREIESFLLEDGDTSSP